MQDRIEGVKQWLAPRTAYCFVITEEMFTDQWKDHVPLWFIKHQNKFIVDYEAKTVEVIGKGKACSVGNVVYAIGLPDKDKPVQGLIADVFKVTEELFTDQWEDHVPLWFIRKQTEDPKPKYQFNREDKTVHYVSVDGHATALSIGDYVMNIHPYRSY